MLNRRCTIVVTGVLGILVGCSDSPTEPVVDPDPDGDGIPSTADACPNQAENINNVFDTDGCPDTPAEFYGVVRADVETYWDGVFDTQEWTYTPISLFTAYTDPLSTPCGTIPIRNAVYCLLNAGVYYHAPFLDEMLAEIGDAAPAFVVAHEIGHHIGSGHLGWFAGVTLTTKQSELGADCFAGAWLNWVDARGLLEEGDAQELAQTMLAIGDPAWTWFDPSLHGTPQQRAAATDLGFASGPWACLPPPGDVGGWVFNDANANGLWDSSEGIWQNVPVMITDHWGRESVVLSDANGRWAATDLPIGFAVADIDEDAFPTGIVRTFGTDPDTVLVVSGGLTEAGFDGLHQPPPSVGVGRAAVSGHRAEPLARPGRRPESARDAN